MYLFLWKDAVDKLLKRETSEKRKIVHSKNIYKLFIVY